MKVRVRRWAHWETWEAFDHQWSPTETVLRANFWNNFTTPVFSHVWAIAGSASRVFHSALFRSSSPARSSSLCSFTGDKTTMLSISRPSWGVWEDKNPGSQALANNTACRVSLRWTHRNVHPPRASPKPQDQSPRLFCAMSLTLVVMMMLVGSSVVFAFVVQPAREEPAASASSPVLHHRSVSKLNLFYRCYCKSKTDFCFLKKKGEWNFLRRDDKISLNTDLIISSLRAKVSSHKSYVFPDCY